MFLNTVHQLLIGWNILTDMIRGYLFAVFVQISASYKLDKYRKVVRYPLILIILRFRCFSFALIDLANWTIFVSIKATFIL